MRVAEPALVGAASGASSDAGRRGRRLGSAGRPCRPPDRGKRYVMARIGTSLTVLGFLFHLGATVTRGIAAGRVPWSNMYEFAMTGTLLIVAVYLAVLLRYDLRFLGTFITGLVVVLLGGAALAFYVEIVPLMDPLKSVWLVIHVFVASLGTAFFALAFALSVLQLMQTKRETRALAASRTAPRHPLVAAPDSCARCRRRRRSRRSPTGSRSSASSSGPSRSSPDPSGPRTRGAATGASTPRRSGPS